MGQVDDLPENAGLADSTGLAEPSDSNGLADPVSSADSVGLADPTGSKDAEDILRTVTQDLQNLQQDVVSQLGQDIKRLQAEKSRLLSDVEKLQDQQRSLQQQQQTALTQRQVAQQQLWAKQLAQALAKQLQALLMERMQSADSYPESANRLSSVAIDSEHTAQMLSSLDATINRTLTSVRQDLSSYQSSLSQQISRMHNLEQQGEAILEALVSRLNQHLQTEASRPQPAQQSYSNGYSTTAPAQSSLPKSSLPVTPVAPVVAPEATIAPLRATRPGLSQFQTGLVMILLATVALSLHNVIVGIIGNVSHVLGMYEIGGFIRLNGLGNALLILWMRMLVVVPLMAAIAGFLYPPVWRDIRAFLQFKDRRLLRSVIGSGFFLFLSQILIYVAIGQVGPGVAVTILFMYPLLTVPLAWWLFGDRPSTIQNSVMVAILLGVVLTAFPKLNATTNISWLGIGTAVLSGIAFACYLISMQISFRKLHPVPVSLIQFVTIFVFTSLCLIVRPPGLGVEVLPQGRPGLIVGGLILGILTLIGYLLNNFGVRFIGAAQASIIAASGPVLTALLAFLIIPGPRTALQDIQIFGILLVTVGVTALSFERLFRQSKPKPIK